MDISNLLVYIVERPIRITIK